VIYFGYINREKTEVTLPVGANNGFAPGESDRGQPTTFLPGRHEHVFTVKVPGDFKGKLVWTVNAGVVQTATATLNQLYVLEVHEDGSAKPPEIAVADVSVRASEPARLNPHITAIASKSAAPIEGSAGGAAGVAVSWSKYRGPGTIAFAWPEGVTPPRQAAGRGRGQPVPSPGIFTVPCEMPLAATCGSVTARFSEPGEYVVRVAASLNGEQGLAFVRVKVAP
jgi:hypothetical protein